MEIVHPITIAIKILSLSSGHIHRQNKQQKQQCWNGYRIKKILVGNVRRLTNNILVKDLYFLFFISKQTTFF